MNSESPNTSSPTLEQLNEARLKRWHQTGEALLTAENLRSWINAAGLVLFAPRPQVVAPAPTLVEAVLGAPNTEATLQAVSEARTLVARLVTEGVALPLNLMGAHGTPGDTPDFVGSAAVFSYVFTLRGDKAWKQPPATSGPLKVSHLALATFEELSRKGPMSAYDLATQLGKEVTETACLRALNELWTHLRVIPLLQPDGAATTWELTSARFTKQIKAGANAGQPTALSALISLYLGQVMVATEEEIASFLSPLAPRSRIREVLHALLGARQLDTIVVEGKTLLHVAGEAPAFASAEPRLEVAEAAAEQMGATSDEQSGEEGSRITKYVPRPRKVGTGFLAKGKPATGKRPFERDNTRKRTEESKPRMGGRDDRERRPFRKPTGTASERRFDKPWEEGKPRRSTEGTTDFRPPRKPRPQADRSESERREFRSGPRPPRRDTDRPERRPRTDDRGGRANRSERPADRRPSAGPFRQREDRAPREQRAGRPQSGSAPSKPAFRRFDAPRREQRPRPEGERSEPRQRTGDFERRPPRKEGGFEGRPRRKEGGFQGRPPRNEGGFQERPRRNAEGSESRPRRKEGSFEARSARPQGGARPFSKSKFGGKSNRPAGKFAKGPGKKPFQKKPSDRTFRPRRDESA